MSRQGAKVSADLASLRAEIDRLDARLVELLCERMRLIDQVREQKRKSGAPPFDRAREQQVVRQAEQRALALGAPAHAARKVMSTVIEASHERQEQPPSETRRFVIVGGGGRMGRLFERELSARGHRVDVLERDEPLEQQRIGAADVVMIAVPMAVAEAVTAAVAPLVRPDALLCDLNSLKAGVCRRMAACPGQAVGLHPMFGPTVRSFRRQKIVACPVRAVAGNAAWLLDELARMGAEIVVAEPDAHDRMMAVVQVLTHFGVMTLGATLARSGRPLAETLPFMSPIYRLELSMVGRLFSQSPELYREILMQNPLGAELMRGFVQEAQALERVVGAGDGAGFVARFSDTARYFESFAAEAMALSDLIIDALMSRA